MGVMSRARRVPAILQMEAAECGAACLAMVLAAHGRWETLDTVRDACGAARDGTSAAALLDAARGFGLEASAFQREPADLARLPLPQILFWGFDHFVVLEKVERGSYVIVDPAHGRRRLGAQDFNRAFTGVTLAFRPAAGFTRTRKLAGLLRRVPAMLQGSGTAFAALVITSFAIVLVGVQLPGLTRIFVDDYLVQGRGDWLLPLLAAMVVVGLLRMTLGALYMRGLLLLQTKLAAVLSARFVWRLFHLPFDFFTQRSAAEVSSRTGLATQVAGTLTGPVANGAVHGLAMLTYVAVMLAYSPLLTGVVLAVSALDMAVLALTAARVRENANRIQMATGEAHAAAVRGVALLEQARATGSEAVLFGRMVDAHVRQINAEQDSGWLLRLVTTLSRSMNRLVALAVLGVGAVQVVLTDMTLGTLMGMLMLAELFAGALTTMTGVANAIGQSSGALGRLGDLLDRDAPADQPGDDAPLPRATGAIACHSVSYAHPHAAPLLRDIDLAVAPGACVAISGLSGSGKSCLARLLVGLVPPTSGRIAVAVGTDEPAACGPADCRGIAFVDQEPFFASGTLRGALTLWDPQIGTKEIAQALADAEILDAVAARPGGIDGRIGEGGSGFSGGERQRLSIARALLQSPRILVLDDATSGLDEAVETRLMRNLRRRGLTLIVMTNRASTARFADQVLAIHDQQLVPLAGTDLARIGSGAPGGLPHRTRAA